MVRITLCGSTRFMEEFAHYNRELSLKGHVVYSVAIDGNNPDTPLTEEQKTTLDAVHKAKIDNSDMIVVLNVDGYIGDSTKSEIVHAVKKGKHVRFAYANWNVNELKPLWEADGIELRPYQISTLCPYAGCENDMLCGPCALCYE